MNYEELYADLTPLEKELKDTVNSVVRLNKTVQKDTDGGDISDLRKTLLSMEEAASLLAERVAAVKDRVEAFDARNYFASGDFTKQLLSECENRQIDVRGEKGVYEMFPFKVRIYGDEERAEEVYINRKKVASIRPAAVAGLIRTQQDKLYKAAFKAEAFMNELSDAYDTACLKSGARIGTSMALAKIYKVLTPMARARKEYDMQAFAFDLARLYEEGPESWMTRTGRRFDFGTSRDGKTGIRVLNRNGIESYISTIRLLAAEE